ncbi:MAG: 3'-5' exonuclease [Bacteroidota bacterium]|nr:3'-5' exonuclease [Bacteroidota bacterium]
MLENQRNDSVLFLDIETVPQYPNWEEVPENFKKLWEKKSKNLRDTDEEAESVYSKAGIYAEFGRIICISVGMLALKGEQVIFRMKSYAGENEKHLLTEFASMLRKFAAEGDKNLCAHNGKGFDFPFIARRMLIHGIRLPSILDIAGKKPWEIKFLDTMELWKFGDYKHYTSLDLLTQLFDIPTPKDDINGSEVAGVFYEDKDLPRIVTYCEKDVLAIAQLFLRWKGEALLKEDQVIQV